MVNLKKLTLIGIPVTDAGLASLQSLPNLERLVFRRTSITEKGFRNFCETRPDCWTAGEYASFPIVDQIREIAVWNDLPEKQRLVTTSNPVQIATIRSYLQRHVDQYKSGWERTWDINPKESITIEIKGPNRRLCEVRFGGGFFQIGFGSYCPMANSEANELRQLLGIATAE